MKKFFMTLVAVCLTANSFAQYESGDISIQRYYGVRMGMNVASLVGDDNPEWDSRTSFNFGAVVGLRLSDTTPVFLESGLYYTERGAKKGKNQTGLTYLEIPVLIKYGFSATDEVHVLPYLGPAFGYGISGKTKRVDHPYSEANPYSESSYKEEYNHLDVGVKFGCGLEWHMLYLEAGYQIGITNIAKDSDKKTIHGNAFFMNVGVNF